MSVVHIGSAQGQDYPPNGFSTNHTLSLGSGSNRIVCAFLVLTGGTSHSITSFTYNGTTFNVPLVVNSGSYFERIQTTRFGYLLDSELPASSGTYACYVESPEPYDACVVLCAYSGVYQAAPPTANDYGTGSPLSGIITDAITAAYSDGKILAACGADGVDPLTWTPGTGQTERGDQQRANTALGASDKDYSSSGSKSMSHDPDVNYYAYEHILVELAAGGATPGGAVYNAPIHGSPF